MTPIIRNVEAESFHHVMIDKATDPTHVLGRDGPTSLVATLGPVHAGPWWWQDVQKDEHLCPLDYERLVYRGKFSQQIATCELPLVALLVLRRLFDWRRKYDYVFSFECDLVGFSISFWQTILMQRRPRHVILQFIMRERQDTWRSRLKYALMRFVFASVHRVVVSSRTEIDLYARDFGWQRERLAFVPLLVAPELLERPISDGEYLIAAGRSLRDYETLCTAVCGTGMRLIIVGGAGTRDALATRDDIEIVENIPVNRLEELMAAAKGVVVPLQDRSISAGQSVLLQAMALGKPVIATATAGTLDYIEHMNTGILVPPKNVEAMREALLMLKDPELRARLGEAARCAVRDRHLPHQYSRQVRAAT